MSCKTKKCGCIDTGLTTPSPCSCDLIACPTPSPCSETFDSCCIIYTGPTIADTHILSGDTMCTIIRKLNEYAVNAKCNYTGECGSPVNFNVTTSGADIILTWDATDTNTTYYPQYSLDGVTWTSATDTKFLTSTITGLTAGTPYYVRVATCTDVEPECTSLVLLITTNS